MSISRRRFNTTMLAAMGAMLTRRALAQADAHGANMAGGNAPSAVPPFPTAPGPVAAGPLDQLERKRLHALDDLHLDASGGDPQGNLDKITDAMVRLYQQVRDGKTLGGEIHFPQGTYALSRSLRPLPDIAFTGENAQGCILKNTSTDGNVYWNAPVLFAGFDQASEGVAGHHAYRPFTADPQAGDRHVLVKAEDYDQVHVGDEIKLLGATNAALTNAHGMKVLRPNDLLKVIVTGKSAVGSDRVLEIDRPLPWALPAEGDNPWGDLRGVPAWMMVREWFNKDLDYWQQPGQHGFDTLTTTLGPQWGMGWTSRRNCFKDITLWSQRGPVMMHGLPCDVLFANCLLQGAKCFYGNSMQYAQARDCTCRFADEALELALNSLYCTFTHLTAIHDDSLGITATTPVKGMITCNERSNGMIFDGLELQCATRKMEPRNTALIISGSNNHMRHVHFTLPELGDVIRVSAQGGSDKVAAPENVSFRAMKIDLAGASYARLLDLDNASHHIALAGVEVTAAAGATVADMRSAACHDVTFADVTAPGALVMNHDIPGVQAVRCRFAGGITGPYAASVQVTPGTPDPARWA